LDKLSYALQLRTALTAVHRSRLDQGNLDVRHNDHYGLRLEPSSLWKKAKPAENADHGATVEMMVKASNTLHHLPPGCRRSCLNARQA